MTRRNFLQGRAGVPSAGVLGRPTGHALASENSPQPAPLPPNFENYATIETYSDRVPVYSLGNITYIYGVSPDHYSGVVMQEGNDHPKVKIKPKKSWEIKRNPFGVTIGEPGPRTMWNDSQPLLPIHLIDGDPNTAWSSYGSPIPDARPEWIRIELPRETTVTAVALVCSQDFAGRKLWEEGKLDDPMDYHQWAGRALPNGLTIQISRDARYWETVYANQSFAGDESGASVIKFEPRPAKQILITGRNFKRDLDKYTFIGYVFSIGGVEVWDAAGRNVALVSRGAGVTVSSTSYMLNQDRFTQGFLFGPVQYDLGLKYIRIGADNGLYTWNYVERVKGRMQVDPVADRAVTELHSNGVNVILNLDVKANFVYKGRKRDWRQARFREINNIYFDHPGWCWESPEMFAGYLRYVDFMVEHFKHRVAYYEIGNEWSNQGPTRAIKPRDIYAKAVHHIKKIDPRARIMVGVGRMSQFPALLESWIQTPGMSAVELALLMPDAVGSHPTTRMQAGLTLDDLDRFYWQENREAIRKATAMGYKGIYIASEVYSWVLYPPGPSELNEGTPRPRNYYFGESDAVRAKCLAQNLVGHAGLDMLAFYCNTYFVGASVGQSLFRVPTPSQTLSALQPEAGYYVLRTLCTVLDEWKGAEFPVTFSGSKRLTTFAFQRGEREMMVAAYIPGHTTDQLVETKCDVTLPGVQAKQAWVIDVLNGTEQPLMATPGNSGTVFKGMMIKDYPTLIHVRR